MKKAIRETEHAIENLWRGIESGQGVDMLMERINQRQAELEELKVQLTIEESKKVYLTEPQILAFLDYVSETAFEDVNKKRAIINIFVNCVYLYDDHYTMSLRDGKNIAFDDFGNTYIPYPPIEEQQAIADYLDARCSKIQSLLGDLPIYRKKTTRIKTSR